METMRKRLAAVRAATAAIRPALMRFYEALDQGQKVRFAGVRGGAPSGRDVVTRGWQQSLGARAFLSPWERSIVSPRCAIHNAPDEIPKTAKLVSRKP
jgi:hypothetical protein